ncbi:MAG TPA: creatininase family protein [Gemmatimonadales bacterium]|nr:creatininase family protein [Gemmatimonadales bacterium]
MRAGFQCFLSIGLVAAVVLSATPARTDGQVRRLEEMSRAGIAGVDRDRAVVLLPGGILEQHGPHLPVFTDGYTSQWFTQRVAEAIVTHTGRPVLVFPQIPLGVGAPEEFAPRQRFPGSYMVRPQTLRAILMDLASALGDDGFRWVFILHDHGPLVHNRVLHEAADYFMETYGGTMAVLTAIPHGAGPLPLSDEQRREDGLRVHAGLWETSQMLFLRPDLVDPGFRGLAPLPALRGEDLPRIAGAPDWPGYFGSPRLAQPDIGGRDLARETDGVVDLALRILKGLDPRTLSRHGDLEGASPAMLQLDSAILDQAAHLERRQAVWLARKGIR